MVQVAPGDYYESIRLKLGVDVQGSGADVTTISGDGSWWQIKWWTYTVLGENESTISGFTITGSNFGIGNFSTSPTITNNIITDNESGIVNDPGSFPIITNNIITGNKIGIGNFGSLPTITNNTIVGNRLYGIRCYYSSPTITNNIITDNGAGIFNDHSSPTITYNDIWDNRTDIKNDDFSFPVVANNISANPMFIDPRNDDYYLHMGSPGIDAGTNEAPALPAIDFDYNPRVLDGDSNGTAVVDMGAYEYVPEATPPCEEPNEELEELIAVVENLDIPGGSTKSLIYKLENALDKVNIALEYAGVEDTKHAMNMADAAINSIDAFINEVEAHRGNKINQEDGAYLEEAAWTLIECIESVFE